MAPNPHKEFVFIHESGDPGFGLGSQPVYLLVAIHSDGETLDDVRRHLASFRYHHNVRREFKDQKWADKLSPPTQRLLDFLATLTSEGRLRSTCAWLLKDTYRRNGGPHMESTWRFRHFQLRRVLEFYVATHPWGDELDVVIDRWRATHEQQANLLSYLQDNYRLRPQIANVTMVDSLYADPIQVADIYAGLARRVVTEAGSPEERTLAEQLMSFHEIVGGLY